MFRFARHPVVVRRLAITLGLFCSAIGLVFYINFRSIIVSGLPEFISEPLLLPLKLELNGFVFGSTPSFLFVIYMSSFSFALAAKNERTSSHVLFWLVVALFAEVAQGFVWLGGTFDWLDVLALVLGALASNMLLKLFFRIDLDLDSSINAHGHKGNKGFLRVLSGMLSLSIFFISIVGSTLPCEQDSCDSDLTNYVTPVFLSVETIREETEISYGDNESLKRTGKIYLYEGYLFVVDDYTGLHIFDNTEAENPRRVAFIPVWGVTDLSIHNDILYSNSYMDLLIIDLRAVLQNELVSDSIIRRIDYFERIDYSDLINGSNRVVDSSDPRLNSDEYIVIGYERADGERVIHGKVETESLPVNGILEE